MCELVDCAEGAVLACAVSLCFSETAVVLVVGVLLFCASLFLGLSLLKADELIFAFSALIFCLYLLSLSISASTFKLRATNTTTILATNIATSFQV